MAARSLQTQMTGVEVSGQNLANVNNPAYSRQRVVIQSSGDVQTGVGAQGTGASVTAITQVVDALLNGQILNQANVTGYWNQMQSSLDTAQTSLGEFLDSTSSSASTSSATSASGLSSQLSTLFNAFQAVAASPTSTAARQSLIGAAQNLATSLNQIHTRLDSLSTALDSSLTSQVDSANQLLTDIATLNDQIANAENYNGGAANDLRDQRQQKLEDLGKLINFQTSTGTNGSVNITVAGSLALVSGNQVVDTLEVADPASTGQLHVYTVNGNTVLTGVSSGLTGGSIVATVDARDGALATLQTSINSLATNLITEVNTLHSAGFSLKNPITGLSSTGADFFTGTDASDIAMDQSLVTDPWKIQAAGTDNDGDGSVALSLADLFQTTLPALNGQTFSGAYGQAVAQLGNALSSANNQAASQTAVATMLANQRSSVSGVSLDEEMTNLLTYQRAYQASAQLLTTVDEMIQTILSMKR